MAKDQAFHHYYPENLELLEAYGAKLVYFSPIYDEKTPENADGLYLGGGLSESSVAQLAQNNRMKQSIKKAIESGMPTFAEGRGICLSNRNSSNNEQ